MLTLDLRSESGQGRGAVSVKVRFRHLYACRSEQETFSSRQFGKERFDVGPSKALYGKRPLQQLYFSIEWVFCLPYVQNIWAA